MRTAGPTWLACALLLGAASAAGQTIELPEVFVAGPSEQVERLETYRHLDLPDPIRENLAKLIADRNQLYQSRDEKVALMFDEFYEENAALNPPGLAEKIDQIDAALTSFDDETLKARNEAVWALKVAAYGGDVRSKEMRRKFALTQSKYYAAMIAWDEANPGAPAAANRVVGRLGALNMVIGSLMYRRGQQVDGLDYDLLFRVRPLPYPEAIIPDEFRSDYREHQSLYAALIAPEANAALVACLNDRFNTVNQQREAAFYDQLDSAEEEVASLDIVIRQKSDELSKRSPKDDMDGYLALKRERDGLRQKRNVRLWDGRRAQVQIWGTEIGRSAQKTFRELHDTECDPAIQAKLKRMEEINFKHRIQEAYPALKDVPLPVVYDISYRGARLTVEGYGTVEIEFLPDEAPAHVANFIKLVRSGFYDGTTFHRVVKGFVIQGGDPNTKDDNPNNDGGGDPGYKQTVEMGPSRNLRGYVGAAPFDSLFQDKNKPRQDAGSQFYFLLVDSPHMDRASIRSTIFAKVVRGMDVLDRIGNAEVDPKKRPIRDIRVTFTLVE